MRNCIEGFTHVQAAGLGRVIAGNSINDGFDVGLLVNGSTEATAAGIVEAMALELADDVTFELADEIALVAAAVGVEIAPAFEVVCTGNAAGSLGFGASSAHGATFPDPELHT